MRFIDFIRQQKKAIWVNLLIGNMLIEVICYLNSSFLQRLVYQIEFSALIIPMLFLAALTIGMSSHTFWRFVIIQIEAFLFFYVFTLVMYLTSLVPNDFNLNVFTGLFSFLLLPALWLCPVWIGFGSMNYWMLSKSKKDESRNQGQAYS